MTEQIIWHKVSDEMPDSDLTVLLAIRDGEVWPGFFDGKEWCYEHGGYAGDVWAWAEMPQGPKHEDRA